MNKEYELMNPMVDFAFKALFGAKDEESEFLLINFLNAVLDFPEGEKIIEVTYVNPYNDKEYKNDKLSIMDVKVRTQNDELIDIEVQINNNQNFRKRSLYYWSKMYAETIKSGDDYSELERCVVLSLLDFTLIDESEKFHTVFRLKEAEENFELLGDLEIHYLETPKFVEQNKHKTEIENWMAFMKTAGDESKKNILKDIRTESEVIDMAVKKLEVLSKDEQQRQSYYAREKALLDEKSKAAYFRRKEENIKNKEEMFRKKEEILKSKEENIKSKEENIKSKEEMLRKKEEELKNKVIEAEKEGKLETAKNLLDVLDVETIALKTGLSILEVEKLKK